MTDRATPLPPLAHLAAIVQSSLDAIIGQALDGVITSWNPGAERMLGHTAAEAVGQPISLIIPEDRREEEHAAIARLSRGERVEHFQTVRRARDGRAVTVSLGLSPVVDAAGALVGMAVIARDITAQRHAAEEVTRSIDRLARAEKLAAMGEMLAGVAHEINNPLAVVLGQTALLDLAAAPPTIKERAEKIRVAAERCVRVMRNFLALARRHPPERTAVDLARVVDEAVELLAYELKASGVSVSLALPADLPRVWGDDAGWARLEVADNGPGIPVAVLPHVFEPFFTTEPAGEGTGLGLSLCRQIVEEHAGRIRVASEPGRGAALVIDLPAVAPAGVDAPARVARGGGPARILVVDDDIDIAVILRDALEADGHLADVADSSAVALELLERQSYDLVLSDARMPSSCSTPSSAGCRSTGIG